MRVPPVSLRAGRRRDRAGGADDTPDSSLGDRRRGGAVDRVSAERTAAVVPQPAHGAGGWNVPDVFEELTFVAVPVVGCVLGSRRPANKIGWIFLAIGLLLGLGFFCRRHGIYGLLAARPGQMPGARAAAWAPNWIWIVPAGGFVFVLLGFPDGRLPSRRWRPAAWFVAAGYALEALGFVMRADRVRGTRSCRGARAGTRACALQP